MSNSIKPETQDLLELQQQVETLKRELAQLKTKNQVLWTLLVEVTRRLQLSSASIKAAVSSLLTYDIFWDGLSQHEFLETIDDSVDQAGHLLLLIALAFRSEAGRLEIKPEPNMLQEILSAALDSVARQPQKLKFSVSIAGEGRPVFADYEYLSLALKLLFQVLVESSIPGTTVKVIASENVQSWHVEIAPLTQPLRGILEGLMHQDLDDFSTVETLSSESVLKMIVACHIFSLLQIQAEVRSINAETSSLRLKVPLVAENDG